MIRRRLLGHIIALFAAGCGSGSSGPAFVPASADPRQNVMVIDQGFDLTVTDLRGRVAAAYTQVCQPASGGGGTDAGSADAGPPPSFDQLKQQYIAALAMPDDSCHLDQGVSAKSDPLASIARYKARWNQMIQRNQFVNDVFNQTETADLMAALNSPSMQDFPYHGTATASTVAHDNPTVRLVLVEIPLDSESMLQQSFTCLVQSDFDQFVALLADPQVMDAYVHQPEPQVDHQIDMAASTYQVGLVNESFGPPARTTLEQLQASSGCPPISLSAYFSAMNAAENARLAALGTAPRLTVQAAGNESAQIDSGADELTCQIGNPLSLVVGSYDLTETRSTFSNFGACVDVSAPGESVVARYAGDWLLPVDGTSFASPMAVRVVSLTAPTPYDPAQARTALLAQRDASGNLPINMFPTDFFYAPGQTLPAFAVGVDLGPAAAGRRLPRRFDLGRVLRPLNRLRRVGQRR
jgi:subtilisin family serine protease